MGGPNLEVFKFGFYLFFPLAAMYYYGDSGWYKQDLMAYKEKIFPSDRHLVTRLPADQSELREELARIRARKLELRAERDRRGTGAQEGSEA